MLSQQIRKFDMLRRIQDFLDTWAAKLGVVNATTARQELNALTQSMADSEGQQATSRLAAKSATAVLEGLRRDLINHHMRPVATIAAAHLRDVPGFKAMQLPNPAVKLAVLVQDAIAMADAARAHQQVFVQNGRSADFADALVAAATAARAALDSRGANKAQTAAARDGLKSTASRAHLVLRLLDAQVKSILKDDPKLLAAWKSAKRIGRGKVVPIEATMLAPVAPVSGQPPVNPTPTPTTQSKAA
jgi:hypothetical protein